MNKKLDSRDKNIYKNSIMSVVYKFASMGLSFIAAPLILACLGQEKYGIWVSLLSLVSWVYSFDLGIGNGLRNKLSTSIAQNDYKSSKNQIAASYALVSLMTAVIFIVAFVALSIFDIGNVLDIHLEDENLNFVITVALFFACLNFVASLANNVLYALQKASTVSMFNVLGQLFYVIAMLIYLVTGQKLLLIVAVAEGLSQILKNVIESVWVYGKNKDLRFSIRNIDFSYSRGIISFGLQMFVMQMAALVLNSTDNLIITKYFGAVEVTPYAFCYRYFGMINGVFVAMITPLLSAYTAAYAKRDIPWIKNTLKKSWILYLLVLLGTILAGLLFKPFSKIWLGVDLNYQNGLIFFTGIYYALLMCSHVFSTLLTGLGAIRETTCAMVIEAIVNVPISIFFAVNLNMGVNGVILGSVACMLISMIVFPWKAIKVLRHIEILTIKV